MVKNDLIPLPNNWFAIQNDVYFFKKGNAIPTR